GAGAGDCQGRPNHHQVRAEGCRPGIRVERRLIYFALYAGRAAPFRKRLMQKPGKIVVASQHYPPDQSTTAAIMSAISGHLAQDTPVLVLSGMAGSALVKSDHANQPDVIEVKNWLPGKAALIKRAM